MNILEVIDQLQVQPQIKEGLTAYARKFGYYKENGHVICWHPTTKLINEDDLPVSFDRDNHFYLEDNLGCKWFLDYSLC